jgi:lipoprotein-releasing system permease protein
MSTQTKSIPFGPFERMLAWRYLFTKRQHGGVALIALISFIGIMLAVAVLIIVMSVMNGFRSELVSRILGFNGHVFVQLDGVPQTEADAVMAAIATVPGVTHAYPLVEGQALISANDRNLGAFVRGINARDLLSLDLVRNGIIEGSLNRFGEGASGGNEIVIGSQLAARLSLRVGDGVVLLAPEGAATPFGVRPNRKSYTVSAIFDVGMSEINGGVVFLPMRQSQLFFNSRNGYHRGEVRLTDPDLSGAVLNEIQALVPPTVATYDWTMQDTSYWSALQVERNVMRLILMLIVAIAVLNVISGLVMLAKNKSRDIAILRTIGATRGAILRIFLMVGASIGFAGTIAGLVLGVVFCLNIGAIQSGVEFIFGPVFPSDIYFLSRIPARIEWSEVLIVSGWAFVMSLLATLPPAWRAAKLDPVEALRFE